MRKNSLITMVALIAFGWGAATGSASLTFYAPYDTSLDLTVGTPSTPTVHGTVPLVPGYNSYGMGGNAANFDALSEALRYGNVTNYLSGVGNSQAVGGNTFRLLMKPDLSNQGGRRMLLTGGNLHANDRIQLQVHDGGDVVLILLASGGGYVAGIPNGTFSTGRWNTNIWFYVGGSIVSNQVNLYVRPLTNGSTAVTATSSMAPVSWGASASSSWVRGFWSGTATT
jgi:hypothetical protein